MNDYVNFYDVVNMIVPFLYPLATPFFMFLLVLFSIGIWTGKESSQFIYLFFFGVRLKNYKFNDVSAITLSKIVLKYVHELHMVKVK